MRTSWWAGAMVGALMLASCTGSDPSATPQGDGAGSPSVATTDSPGRAGTPPTGGGGKPLRAGERYVDVTIPRPYRPEAPGNGTDDYRCFLLDPGLAEDAFVTGIDVVPGNPDLVHHVILFRVEPSRVRKARSVDSKAPGQGWTCFGGSGLEQQGASLDQAPWLGAWAPGGGEQVMAPGIGIPVEEGSRIVMQVHYNLLGGSGTDSSSARLRVASGAGDLSALDTVLLPAPVELPCRDGVEGPLCDRETAVLDLMSRFGTRAGQTVAGLQLLCNLGGPPDPGPVQSCARQVTERATVRAVAGHMHLLGRSIRVEVNPDRPRGRTLLEIPVWDFDDQGARPLRRPARLRPGDELKVTCTHDQGLRDRLPAFAGRPERYVVWGDGTTDEMCLGIVLVTRP